MKEQIKALNTEEKEMLKTSVNEIAEKLEEIELLKEDIDIVAGKIQNNLGIKKTGVKKLGKEKHESFIDEKLVELSEFEESYNLLWKEGGEN